MKYKEYVVKEYPNGDRHWYLDGELHRADGPAREHALGHKEWWLNGKRHREDGPAVEYPDGSKEWWVNGKLHRENAPAIEYVNGYKEWYSKGKLHREGGPAIEYSDGSKEWYQNRKLHRADGPAIEYTSGYKAWWANGEEISKEEFDKLSGNKFITIGEVEKKIEVLYDGKYPNTCSGTLIIKVDGGEIYNKSGCCCSTGNVWFDEEWQEHIDIGVLEWEDADCFSEQIAEAVRDKLSEFQVCCGGCV
jgi:hypothetical protein